MPFTRRFRRAAFCAGLALSLAGTAHAQVAVTTAHNDNARTGQNLLETALNVSNVDAARFGKLFSWSVDAPVWGQPLIVPNVATAAGTKTVAYVYTEHGTVYAFDANSSSATAPLWKVNLLPSPFDASWKDQNVGMPVIDAASGTIYLILKNWEGTWVFRLFALDIRTGVQKNNSGQIISATVTASGKGSSGGNLTMKSPNQKQRPALLLAGGNLYASFGGSVDEYDPFVDWNGWVYAFDAATLGLKYALCIAPNGNGGGIWQAGNGLAADGSGNVYGVTGNGNGIGPGGVGQQWSFDADTGGFDYGNSIVKMSAVTATSRPGVVASGGKMLSIADYFTPYNWKYVETADQDLGASGPMLVPGTSWVITGDKQGRMYVVNTANMGKFQAGSNSQIVNDFAAWKGHLHGGPVYYNSPSKGALVYGWSEHDYLKAYRVTDIGNKAFNGTPNMKSGVSAPPGMPGGFLSISANGSTANTAILWSLMPYVGDANKGIVQGVLRAFDANNLSTELWNSKLLPARDDFGLFAKFASPTIANGRVYVPTFSSKLAVYGLLPAAAKPAVPLNLTATGQLNQVTLTWSASAGATSYTVNRGTVSGGAYTTIARNVLGTSYVDTAVTPGTTYYYYVAAGNSGGFSANSQPASATPFGPANGTVISIDFTGGGNGGSTGPSVTPMGITEVAGQVPVPTWNAAGGTTGTLNNLRSNGGSQTTAAANWSCLNTAATNVADNAGNNRMMKGYLSNNNTSGTTLSVSALPAAFTSAGYDVYVYADGANPTATRTANFTLGTATLAVTDAQNRDFEGNFVLPGVANAGNYVIFKNLTAASFQINAVQGSSTDTTPRAPLNGVQIVQHQNATQPSLAAPQNMKATPYNGLVATTWSPVSGAATYSVKRSTTAGGPYTVVASGLTQTKWNDPRVVNGTTYYYVAAAVAGTAQSNNSNEAAARPLASYTGRIISIDFAGSSTTAMAATETAGTPDVQRARWNRAALASGSLANVLDDSGATTTADLTWSATSVGNTGAADTAGNSRMMRGFINAGANTATVTVSALPASITAQGYDVWVYVDDNNSTASRRARYDVGGNAVTVTDASGATFSGTFTLGNSASGNFVKIMGITGTGFTLTASSVSSSDGVKTAAINGFQIVGRSNPAPAAASPASSTQPATSSSGQSF